MKVGIAQISSKIGDFPGNAKRILQAYRACVDAGAEIVVTPEMSLVGYPPRDLVHKQRFVDKCLQALDYLADETRDIPLVVGYIDYHDFKQPGKTLRNAAAFLHKGKILHKVWKTLLPSYDIFDEHHYFEPSSHCTPIEFNGTKIGLTICEDIWVEDFLERPIHQRDPVGELIREGADILINISASPFHLGKPQQRADLLEVIACGARVPLVFCNAVGANEQLVFGGHSMALDSQGNEIASLPGFESCFKVVDLKQQGEYAPEARSEDVNDVYQALKLGLRRYVTDLGYESVCLALDGRIDSSLAACIACETLGKDKVFALILTNDSKLSPNEKAAQSLAEKLGIEHHVMCIEPACQASLAPFQPLLKGVTDDISELNLRDRVRANMLMLFSNKFNHLVLSSANKTDLSIGDFTVYGDSGVGLALLSDVPKLLVHNLITCADPQAKFISQNVIEEERLQFDTQRMTAAGMRPAYTELDPILRLYIEYQLSGDEIIHGHEHREHTVRWVQRHVDLNAWKRQQSPPGIRVTSKAFGMRRRIPIVQGFID